MHNYGSDTILIIHLVLKMVAPEGPDDAELKKFLVLNKEVHERLQQKVYKQALLYESDPQKLNIKRNKLWVRILNIDADTKDYYSLRDKVNADNQEKRQFEDNGEVYQPRGLSSSVSELISMDVQRSFHSFKHIVKPEILKNILKTYAFWNPEIEYCQGMNFVAGFLFLVFRDEQMSFKALMIIAEKYDMSHLYKKELPKLKLFFY